VFDVEMSQLQKYGTKRWQNATTGKGNSKEQVKELNIENAFWNLSYMNVPLLTAVQVA